MPTFKHPCPYCAKFIDRASAACPYCGVREPFSPKRCQACRKIVEDPAWTVCPSCGASLVAPAAGQGAAGGQAVPTYTQPAPAPAAMAPPPAAAAASGVAAPAAAPVALAPGKPCSGCGAPIPSGARFCTVCGTLAG